MNLILSWDVKTDRELSKKGLTFLGAGKDWKEKEVHVWLKEGCELAEHMEDKG